MFVDEPTFTGTEDVLFGNAFHFRFRTYDDNDACIAITNKNMETMSNTLVDAENNIYFLETGYAFDEVKQTDY